MAELFTVSFLFFKDCFGEFLCSVRKIPFFGFMKDNDWPASYCFSVNNFFLCFSRDNDWDFLSLRFWVGIWTTGFLLFMVVFNMSALVRYLTRFTEESFACLIALIFIVEAFSKLADIGSDEPMRLHADEGRVSWVWGCLFVF